MKRSAVFLSLALTALTSPLAAGATSTPVALTLPQSVAFALLGHSCGGIHQKNFASGFDSVSGYPQGNTFLSTTCSTGGRGAPSATFTRWAAVTWDFTGAVVSSQAAAATPTVNPTLVVADGFGNSLTNSSNNATLTLGATFVPVPRVTALSTAAGPASGGTPVQISGTGFSVGDVVKFGSMTAAVTATTPTSLSVVAPAQSGGTVPVTVSNSGGTSSSSPADAFTFVNAPTVSSLSPGTGPVTGGTTVTVTGTNLSAVTSVTLGETPVGFVVLNDTTLQIVTPSNDVPDTAALSVSSLGGVSAPSAHSQFTYVAPLPALAVSPAVVTAGHTITVTGANFIPGESVRVAYATKLVTPTSVTICSGVVTTGGQFSCHGVLRVKTAGARGSHVLTARGTQHDTAKALITLK